MSYEHIKEEADAIRARVSISAYCRDNLERARAGQPYVCPYCGSGGHGNASSDSALKLYESTASFTCHACYKSGDIFDLAGEVHGLEGFGDKVASVAEWAGIPLTGDWKPPAPTKPAKKKEKPQQPAKDYTQARKAEEAKLQEWRQRLDDPRAVAYLEGRGWTLEQAKAAGFGYDPNEKRLIIPYIGAPWYHIDRATEESQEPKYKKPKSELLGGEPIYNAPALDEPAYFVAEGAFDALAIMRAGFPAIALNGSSVTAALASEAARHRYSTAVLVPDRDETGEAKLAENMAKLKNAGVSCLAFDAEGLTGKDADEWAQHDPEEFKAKLWTIYEVAKGQAERDRAEAYRNALESLRVLDPVDVASRIYNAEGLTKRTATGFEGLDKMTGGGLPAGLTILGAVSSVGKTTLALQMADSMAAAGESVLFVTIEQSASELVAKSLSRIMQEQGTRAPACDICDPATRDGWTDRQEAALLDACGEYTRRIGGRLRIFEGTAQPSVKNVRDVVDTINAAEGAPPVVFIDYLQLLKSDDPRDSDKTAIDKNVMQLRHLARDMRTPVIVISSLNRDSYGGNVKESSFKESGAIEYGADLLLGLQPAEVYEQAETATVDEKKRKGVADKLTRQHKAAKVRRCELYILKNRHGRFCADPLLLDFDAAASMFTESAN